MAQSNVLSTNFCFEVSKITDLTSIMSPEFIIYGIPWKVQVRKRVYEGIESLGAFLFCGKKDKSPNWSYAANATYKLLSFAEGGNAVERQFHPDVFDSSGIGHGFSSLISWNDLFDARKGYVKNDAINLDIQIKAADPNSTNKSDLICANVEKCCEEGCLATFRLTVTNIDNLMAVRKKGIILRNIDWLLVVFKSDSGNLGVRLHNKMSSNECSCNVRMSCKLISSKVEEKKVERTETGNVKYLNILEIGNLISWTELLKQGNGYVENGSIVIEVELKVGKPVGALLNAEENGAKMLKMECAICFEGVEHKEVSSLKCGHMFCTACITKAIEARKFCPKCAVPAKLEDLRRTYLDTLN